MSGHRGEQIHEARLVERFRQGDRAALDALFERHVDGVFRYARSILGSREDAEEATSEAFLRAFRHAAEYRGDGEFRGWVFRIARNLCRDRLRQPRLLTLPDAEIENEGPGGGEAAAVRADVRAAMALLPAEHQDVLILCDVEGWDAREAAEMLGRSSAATKSLLYRARRALRARLTERWDEEL